MKLRMTFYVLIVLSILAILYPITSSAQDASVYMYWTDETKRKIQRADIHGFNVEDLVTTGLSRPRGIALDVAGGKMYWTDWNNKIWRSNLDGTNVEDLVTTGLSYPNGIALDVVDGKMYWANGRRRKIQRSNLDGTRVEDLVTTGLVWPMGIALDVAGEKIYWTDPDTDKIQRSNLDGTNVEDLVTTGLMQTEGIALDVVGEKMYWTDFRTDKIQRSNLDGTNVEDLVTTGLILPLGIALDVADGKMYWADGGTNKIQRSNLDGTNVEDLVTGLSDPFGIALGLPQTGSAPRFSPNIIADQTFTVGTYAGVTLPNAIGGTPPYTYSTSALPTGLSFDPATRRIHGTPTTVTNAHPVTYTATDTAGRTASLSFTITVQNTPPVTNRYIYWTDSGTGKIQRAHFDGTNIQDLVTTGLPHPKDIELDIASGKMYWVDAGTRKVQRANLDGSNVEDLVNTQGRPFGIAVDVTMHKMYWSTWNPGKIRRSNLDGTNVEDFVTGLSEPEDIDLDLSAGKIYWTDTVTNKIQRADLDGTNVEDLVTVGLSHPLGLTLDVAGGKMYWTNNSFFPWGGPGLDKIQRANLDGTNVEDLITTGLVVAIDIEVDAPAGKMYWTDAGLDKIQRSNLDGTNVEDVVTTGLIAPDGLALGIPQTSGGLRFSPSDITDQAFTVGTYASLNLPIATGGTAPYTYTLTPNLPVGLLFNAPNRSISGTPTTPLPTTAYTYTATDAAGQTAALTFTMTVTGAGGLDVNADGQVNVLDLILVAVFYGTRGDGLPADVNADGIVNVQDFAAVAAGVDAAGGLPLQAVEAALLAAAAQAGDIEAIAGAPTGFGNRHQRAWLRNIAYRNVTAALTDVRHFAARDVRLGQGVALLVELLQLLKEINAIPETTVLLPNYPNPFNPETWIPYHLAMDADVTVAIYNVQGDVVRQLMLGHQAAGVYEGRGRAAYWNGRNQIGEPVASGLYFYTLTAGDFTATRKLLIAK